MAAAVKEANPPKQPPTDGPDLIPVRLLPLAGMFRFGMVGVGWRLELEQPASRHDAGRSGRAGGNPPRGVRFRLLTTNPPLYAHDPHDLLGSTRSTAQRPDSSAVSLQSLVAHRRRRHMWPDESHLKAFFGRS